MNSPLSGPLLVAALVLLTSVLAALVVGVVLAARSARRQAAATGELTAALAASEARAASLAERLARLERRSAGVQSTEPLTGQLSHPAYAGEEGSTPATSLEGLEGRVEIDGRLFTDIVARETTIKAAGLWHGLRVALTPENRNRIRFEMKQEVKRSRRHRRDDLKAALRELRARERAAMAQEERDGEDAA